MKIISGGQTGADRTALEIAHGLGFETGGTAPRDYRTEYGRNLILKTRFNLVESVYMDYAHRTAINVRDADITVWYGTTDSPGYKCTLRAASRHKKPFYVNLDGMALFIILKEKDVKVLNVAGNRASKNPSVVKLVHLELGRALQLYKDFVHESKTDKEVNSASDKDA